MKTAMIIGYLEKAVPLPKNRGARLPPTQLGAFRVIDGDEIFLVSSGPGFTKEKREKYWALQDTLIGSIIEYRQGKEPEFIGFLDRKGV